MRAPLRSLDVVSFVVVAVVAACVLIACDGQAILSAHVHTLSQTQWPALLMHGSWQFLILSGVPNMFSRTLLALYQGW